MFHPLHRAVRILVLLAMGSLLSSPASAADLTAGQSLDAALTEARRALEIAKIEMRLYLQVEYPKERRCLDAQIELLSAEIDALKERAREYQRLQRSRSSRPFLTSLQEIELALLDAKLRLKDVRADRTALHRFHPDCTRLHELRVETARARVVALDHLRHGS